MCAACIIVKIFHLSFSFGREIMQINQTSVQCVVWEDIQYNTENYTSSIEFSYNFFPLFILYNVYIFQQNCI